MTGSTPRPRTPIQVRIPHESPVLRIIVASVGIGIICFGISLIIPRFDLERLIGLALWLAAAVVVHDFLFVPIVTVLRTALVRRLTGRRFAAGPRLGAHGAGFSRILLSAVSLVSVVVVPEILAQGRGTANPTILPGAYAANLGWLWLSVGVAIGVAHVLDGLTSRTLKP